MRSHTDDPALAIGLTVEGDGPVTRSGAASIGKGPLMSGFVPEPPTPRSPDASADEVHWVDEVCDRFEVDWNAGTLGEIDKFCRWCRSGSVRCSIATALGHRSSLPPGGPDRRPDARMPRSGDVVGDYLVLEPLARGGMGCVYKAIHQRMPPVAA